MRFEPPLPSIESPQGEDDRKTTLVHPRPAEPKEADPLLGAVLESRYKILRQLGSGGMSTVYLAQNLSFDGFVAVKFIRPRITSTREVMSRCVLEAKALASIPSNFIVRAHDVRTLPNGQIYIVMEYLEGEDLNALIRREGPIPWRRAAKMIRMVCAGLAAAHKRQLLHRDIKPQNCFRVTLDEDPDHIKLIDFGIAKDVTADHEITEAGMILGTPEYMAPELMDERCPPDPRSDLYAVGITLYKLLTGVVPFTGRNPLEVCARHSNDPVVPPSQRTPGLQIPPTADLIVLRALAKDPQRRYQSALTMIRDIEATLARSPTGPLPTIAMEDLGPSISMSSSSGPSFPFPGSLPPIVQAPPTTGSVRPFVGAPQVPTRETRLVDPLAPPENPPGRTPRTTQQYGSPALFTGASSVVTRPPANAPTFTPAGPPLVSSSSTAWPTTAPSSIPQAPVGSLPSLLPVQSSSPAHPPVAQLPSVDPPPPRVVRKREIVAKIGLPGALAAIFGLVTWRLAAATPDVPPPPPPPERVDRAAAEPTLPPSTSPAAPSAPPQSIPPVPEPVVPTPEPEPTITPTSEPEPPTTPTPEPSPPPPNVKPVGYNVKAAGALLKEQKAFIQKTCLTQHGAPDKATLTIVVDKGGVVRSMASDVLNPVAKDCLTRLVHKILFPRSPHGATFVYTHPTARTREVLVPVAPKPRGAR